jgi:hypothetical protein
MRSVTSRVAFSVTVKRTRAQRLGHYGGAINFEADAAIVVAGLDLVEDSAVGGAIQLWPIEGPESLLTGMRVLGRRHGVRPLGLQHRQAGRMDARCTTRTGLRPDIAAASAATSTTARAVAVAAATSAAPTAEAMVVCATSLGS